jgi:hypothetical protein
VVLVGRGTVVSVDKPLTLFPDLPPKPPAPDPLIPVLSGQVVDTGHDRRWGLGTAVFNAARTHRPHLSRVWDPELPRLNFLMLNPSTADALKLDRTVTRCAGFARDLGFGALAVTNCYALRSTDPTGLRRVPDPVGAGNDEAILAAARAANLVVAGWGTHATYLNREAEVRRLLHEAGIELWYLELTKHGHPRHPLYIPAATRPVRWEYTPSQDATV